MKLVRMIRSRAKALLAGARIGRGTYIHPQAVLERKRGTIALGERCTIAHGAQLLAYGGSIEIGNHCSVNPGCILYGHGGLKIGNDVRIAANTVIIPANHVFIDPGKPIRMQGETKLGVTIGNDVWIGAGAIILDGVSIADGCVIGAGAIVTRSTEPFGIYVGNPARLIKKRGA
ncbi:MAG: acyltransferase [Verrucomicrobiota bacterium]